MPLGRYFYSYIFFFKMNVKYGIGTVRYATKIEQNQNMSKYIDYIIT